MIEAAFSFGHCWSVVAFSNRHMTTNILSLSPNVFGRRGKTAALGVSTWAVVLCAVLVSSDLIALRPGGFTLRPSDLLMAVAVLLALPEALGSVNFRWPVGFGLLLTWTAFVLIFIPNTPFPMRSVGYAAWLLLDVAFVFATVQIIDRPTKLALVLRWYAVSFGALAAFGLLQFFLPFLGVSPPLVRQWWVPGSLARVNGLSYEPSYFAGYMVVGWVFVTSLARHRSILLSRRTLQILVVLTSLVLIVCGSRSGWVIMLGWSAWYLFQSLKKKPIRLLAAALVLVAVGAGIVYKVQANRQEAKQFLNGTGLMGTASYSVSVRLRSFDDTLGIFAYSPFVGVSLGGIIPAIASRKGQLLVHQSETKTDAEQSQGTTAEVLAATGIFGFPFYVFYMLGLVWKPRKLCNVSPELRALVNSFVAAMIVMQIQTNILQGYVWLAIALLSACFTVLKGSRVHLLHGAVTSSSRTGVS